MSEPIKLVVVAQRKWWQSKMTGFNSLIALAAIIPLIEELIAKQITWTTVLIFAAATINVYLRVFKTGSPLTDAGLEASQPPNTSA